ncbi:MAG TPA: methyltransferase domain-containing protein [Pirellulales bacterium]|nr:methyltransferase domain-containing protein [Pirellulales bacterium]
MNRRARSLTRRLKPWLKAARRAADIGSGTGHNAEVWRNELGILVDEYDVADLHWVGPGPVLFDGERPPAAHAAYDTVTLLFVLQYVPDPVGLLRRVAELCDGSILLIQSTYRGAWGKRWLRLREWIYGRLSLDIARRTGVLASVLGGDSCPLTPRRFFSRAQLRQTLEEAGLIIHHFFPSEWPGLSISRDLYVLRSTVLPPLASSPTFPSSSPPATKSVG